MKPSLFLMEQMIAVCVFTVCAAVCVSVFVSSRNIAAGARDRHRALIWAESAAERFKANPAADAAEWEETLYYDADGIACPPSDAYYILRVETGQRDAPSSSPVFARIRVEKASGQPLLGLTVAGRKAG